MDRLRDHYADVDRECSECGFVDEDGEWSARTTGSRIDYRHVCPSCGAIEVRTLKLK
ncbi:HVO_0649 family zinc finger protein [Haloferax sp. S1W]|uniref:HVO_0649 family zinc finger protein n=1 Tax=Haloferax sp. S1W TaxID=3377110 RepID=UPI0037C917FE